MGWYRGWRCLGLLACFILAGCAETTPGRTATFPPVLTSTASPITSLLPFNSSPVASIVTSASPTFGPTRGVVVPAGTMTTVRAAHTATALQDGRVLIVGGCTLLSCDMDAEGASAELYDPVTGTFTRTGTMSVERSGHTATLLPDGRVLIVAGWRMGALNEDVEVYDPATGRFSVVGKLATARGGHTAVPLGDGRVLISGGSGASGLLASAEIFDTRTGMTTPTGALTTPRGGAVAVALADGRVLVLGGSSGRGQVLASAEVYDPTSGTFARTGDTTIVRHKHAAIRLRDGRVLVVGGSDSRDFQGRYASVELYDPATGTFAPSGEMTMRRFKLIDSLALLPSGEVLIAGGGDRPEVYDPVTATFHPASGTFGTAWSFATASPLPDGRVLIVGGYDDRIRLTAGAWVYTPGR